MRDFLILGRGTGQASTDIMVDQVKRSMRSRKEQAPSCCPCGDLSGNCRFDSDVVSRLRGIRAACQERSKLHRPASLRGDCVGHRLEGTVPQFCNGWWQVDTFRALPSKPQTADEAGMGAWRRASDLDLATVGRGGFSQGSSTTMTMVSEEPYIGPSARKPRGRIAWIIYGARAGGRLAYRASCNHRRSARLLERHDQRRILLSDPGTNMFGGSATLVLSRRRRSPINRRDFKRSHQR